MKNIAYAIVGVILGLVLFFVGVSSLTNSAVKCGDQVMQQGQQCDHISRRGSASTNDYDTEKSNGRNSAILLVILGPVLAVGGAVIGYRAIGERRSAPPRIAAAGLAPLPPAPTPEPATPAIGTPVGTETAGSAQPIAQPVPPQTAPWRGPAPIPPARPVRPRRWLALAIPLGVIVVIAVLLGALLVAHSLRIGPWTFESESPNAASPAPQYEELPFSGLGLTQGIAVDPAGTVYLSDYNHSSQLVLLAPGSPEPTTVTYPSLFKYWGTATGGMAADQQGNIYIDDNGVQKLAPGATDTTRLPFPKLRLVNGVTADAAGAVYVIDYDNEYHSADPQPPRVWKLAPDGSAATQVDFPGLRLPFGIAVGSDGTLYILDTQVPKPGQVTATVWRLPVGAATPQAMLGLTSISTVLTSTRPQCLAIDTAGNLYVNLGDRVLRRAADTGRITTLPVHLGDMQNVTVDTAGNVYITTITYDGSQHGHVLKLPKP